MDSGKKFIAGIARMKFNCEQRGSTMND